VKKSVITRRDQVTHSQKKKMEKIDAED